MQIQYDYILNFLIRKCDILYITVFYELNIQKYSPTVRSNVGVLRRSIFCNYKSWD